MRLRDSFLNLLGAKDAHTNNVNEAQKTSNQLLRSGRDFLRYGNREQILPGWADVHMSDEDMYRGYSYAVIQKRGNKVASLAKENLRTFAKPEVVDAFQKEEETVEHPYLKMIRNSSKFTEKQFWKNISIYLDLAGRYYLGVVRREIKPLKDNLPIITTDIQEFILLNPYEIRRVVDKDHELAGYIERKKDGRYREWPKYQIIEMRELNPFNSDDGQWAMTDAAKEAVFTLNQSGDYTRQSISGNIDAPGIITTDVILEDEDFENFKSRVTQHRRGEPLFGNGPGAIKWDSMQVDLDKAALLDINEINRTTLFAVSGTSKTSLGIEQSGTTRETARVQSEQFVSDTAQPRLEDIVDFLNLDYKRHYAQEFDKTGYSIYVQSAVGKDYDSETKATQLRQVQIELAMSLMQSGYTKESAYQYAQGDIGLSDLELEDGLDKPKTEDDNPEGEEGNTPQTPPEAPQGGSNGGNGSSRGSENESDSGTNNGLDLDLEPHGDLVENSNGGGNPNHESVESPKDGQSKTIKKALEDFEEPVSEKIDVSLTESKKDNSVHIHQDNVVCPDCENKLEDLRNENKELDKLYQGFLKEISALELEMVEKASRRVTVNAFTEDDIVGPRQKKNYLDKLKKLLSGYWGNLFVLFGKDTVEQRNREFNTNQVFTLDNSMTERIDDNANRVADGHYQTIVNDILGVANRAYTAVAEGIAADLIVEAYKVNPDKFADYFDSEPSRADALKSIQKTDILEENKRIYEKANKMAYDGYKRADIVKAIRESYPDIKENRATLIAGNETARAYGRSQYEADLQFLRNTGMMGKAYKRLVSSRPKEDRDKICPFCSSLIEKTKNSPIPFTEPFLKFGDSIEVVENGVVKNFTANYENIDSGTCHPRCFCFYELIIKENNANGDKVSNVVVSTDDNNNVADNGDDGIGEKVENFNDKHEPAGSPKGGQFAKKDGGPAKKGTSDSVNSKTKEVAKNPEELRAQCEEIMAAGRVERDKILDGAYESKKMAKFLSSDPKNAKIATEEQLDRLDKLNEKVKSQIRDVSREYWKSKGEYTEPGFYKDESSGQVYEVVEDWKSEGGGPTKQVSYSVDAPYYSMDNTYLLYNKDKGLKKVSKEEAKDSIKDGETFGGVSKRDEATLKSYSNLTPQNLELRKGKSINEIRSAKELKGIIDRTKSEKGTFYRGFRGEDDAKKVGSLKVGDRYEDKGFMSTSRDRDIAKGFSDKSGVKVLMEVVSKGGYGKSINLSPYSDYWNESEELFNAGSKGKVAKVREEDGYKIVTLELD